MAIIAVGYPGSPTSANPWDWWPVVGFAFNSTGRYACGAQMRARFIPRILKAPPESLLDAVGVPWEVVVHHQVRALEVEALPCGVGRYEQPNTVLLCPSAVDRHPLSGRVGHKHVGQLRSLG